MKILMRYASSILIALTFNASAQAVVVFQEEFTDGFTGWNQFGSPSSQIVNVDGRTDVFDNNGAPSYDSGIVSQERIDFSAGTSIIAEVYLDVWDTSGCWGANTFAISETENPAGINGPARQMIFQQAWLDLHVGRTMPRVGAMPT